MGGEPKPEDYVIIDSLRFVRPYYFDYVCTVRSRWSGQSILDVFIKEFPDRGREYYAQALAQGRLRVEGRGAAAAAAAAAAAGAAPVLQECQRTVHVVHRHEPPVPAGPILQWVEQQQQQQQQHVKVFTVVGETPDLVAVNKPAGIPVHMTGPYRKNTVLGILSAERPDLGELLPVHRLDRPVSGLLLFARHAAAAEDIRRRIEDQSLVKVYVARVLGTFPATPEAPLVVDVPLAEDLLTKHVRAVPAEMGGAPRGESAAAGECSMLGGKEALDINQQEERQQKQQERQQQQKQKQQEEQRCDPRQPTGLERKTFRKQRQAAAVAKRERREAAAAAAASAAGGMAAGLPMSRPAVTEFRLLEVAPDGKTSLVECRPRTGRSHQIRVHLQYLGHPIANDVQYGGTYRGPIPTAQLAKHMGVSWDVPEHGLTMFPPSASAALEACGEHPGASEEQREHAFLGEEGHAGGGEASQQQGTLSSGATGSQAVQQAAHRQRRLLPAGPGLLDLARSRHVCHAKKKKKRVVREEEEQPVVIVQQPAAEEEAEQQQEAEAEGAVYDAEAHGTTAEADGTSQQQLAQQQVVRAVPPTPQVPVEEAESFNDVWKIGLGGIAALAGVAALAFLGHRLFKSQAPKVQEAIEKQQASRESVQRLQKFISQIRNSTTADLSSERLGDEGFAYIIDALSFNDRCVAADFSKVGVGVPGIQQLCTALGSNTVLETLLLETNNAGDEGAALLAQTLAGGTRIKHLNLTGNNIGDVGAKALAEMLKVNTTLEELQLNGNVIDYDGITAIAEALTTNTSLKVLGISDNYIGALGAGVLGAALRQNESLQELTIKGNELGDEGVKVLCEALKERKGEIKALDMGNNTITAVGAAALADLLRGNNSLTDVNINMNDVGDDGAFQLAASLKDNRTLKTLDVGGNNIGPDGGKALAAALRGNESLQTLELGYNPIGPEGAKAFSDLLKYDMKVETLKLGWCKIGAGEGAKAVADLIMFNTTLRTLDLRGNGFGNDGAIYVSRGMKEHTNEQLRDLDMGYNEIKDEGACALAQALKANPSGAPKDLKLNSNYITKFGQVALTEALDMVYDMARKQMVIHF
ncbi:hypothetical protein N2152v2_003038 [Parachlorella kessleri]